MPRSVCSTDRATCEANRLGRHRAAARRLEAQGLTGTAFPAYVERVRRDNARRVREGDLDHLVFYLLQSTHFTTLPPIEPALSAKALVESLDPPSGTGSSGVRPPASRPFRRLSVPGSRRSSMRWIRRRAIRASTPLGGSRISARWCRRRFPTAAEREAALLREYLRAMRFVYQKEFVAQRRRRRRAVAELYRTRGLSTDTAVEAGYRRLHSASASSSALQPDRRIRRVLIVGPGLDLAPRTGLRRSRSARKLSAVGRDRRAALARSSRAGDLEVVGADINPRVVAPSRRIARRCRRC